MPIGLHLYIFAEKFDLDLVESLIKQVDVAESVEME
jgi:hypothetical protein